MRSARTAVLLLAVFVLCAPTDAVDLVLALATYPAAHHVLEASRSTWRKDVFTVVSTQGPDGEPEHVLEKPFPLEVWVSAPDGRVGWEGRGGNRAEGRLVGLIRVANSSVGLFNWLLSSDDDVLWYEDNVRALTNRLDAAQPLYITDGFLNDVWSACALRSDAARAPLHSSVDGVDCLRAPPTQPCLRSVLEQQEVRRSVRGHLYRPAYHYKVCSDATLRDKPPGTWAQNALQVGAYGNYGSIMSRGLLASLSASDFEACENCNSTGFTCMHGADWRLGECFLAFAANGRGVGPTLPGLHPGGFRQFGHPADSVLALSRAVVAGGACDDACLLVLNNVITSPVSAHGKTKDEYRTQLEELHDTYAQAKALLQARKPSLAPLPPGETSFTYRSADGPYLQLPGGGRAPDAFLLNFDECLDSDPLTSPVLDDRRYGPFPQGGPGFTVAGFRRGTHPVVHMSTLPTEEYFLDGGSGPSRLLPTAASFAAMVKGLNRKTPIVYSAFQRELFPGHPMDYHAGITPIQINWLAHMAHVGLIDHALVVVKHWKDCHALSPFVPCLVHTRMSGGGWSDPHPGMHLFAQNFRWIYNFLFLNAGIDVMNMDGDAILLRDPLPGLAQGRDVAGLSDRNQLGKSPMGYCDEPHSPCQSTGTTFFRAMPDVLRVVRNFTLHFEGGFEQAKWDPYAVELVLLGKYDFMPNIGAPHLLANWGDTIRWHLEQKIDFDVTLLHLGGMRSDNSKEFVFRCAQLWLDERNLEP